MQMTATCLEAIRYSRRENTLSVLDQLKLPQVIEYVEVKGVDDAWTVIRQMQVRGAPAIAIVGMLALAVEVESAGAMNRKELIELVRSRIAHLETARPTAVNLRNACRQMEEIIKTVPEATTGDELRIRVSEFAESMLIKDIETNKAIGRHGADTLLALIGGKKEKLVLLTICNTGALATAGYGTALGVIREMHSRDRLEHVYALETRPYCQGARLTCFELLTEAIPGTLIVDSAAGWLMRSRTIDAVLVGADCVAMNGDTANKIGTYGLAVIAKHHGVPFFACVPSTTLNTAIIDGSQIPIEERPSHELRQIQGVSIAPEGFPCWNPAFDVTPAEMITGIVTEFGTFVPSQLRQLLHMITSLSSDE